MNDNLLKRIVTDPDIMAGKPTIKETRIPVDLIIRMLGQGMTVEEILADYPHLTREDIQAALLYGAEIVSGEEIFPLTTGEK